MDPYHKQLLNNAVYVSTSFSASLTSTIRFILAILKDMDYSLSSIPECALDNLSNPHPKVVKALQIEQLDLNNVTHLRILHLFLDPLSDRVDGERNAVLAIEEEARVKEGTIDAERQEFLKMWGDWDVLEKRFGFGFPLGGLGSEPEGYLREIWTVLRNKMEIMGVFEGSVGLQSALDNLTVNNGSPGAIVKDDLNIVEVKKMEDVFIQPVDTDGSKDEVEEVIQELETMVTSLPGDAVSEKNEKQTDIIDSVDGVAPGAGKAACGNTEVVVESGENSKVDGPVNMAATEGQPQQTRKSKTKRKGKNKGRQVC